MAGKLPFMKFFPDDWMSDLALRSVSPAARGVWMDMLCLMWKSPRRGYLCHRSGLPLTLEQLGRTTGCATAEVDAIVSELIACGVSSKSEDGVIFSRRMVREEQQRQTNQRNGCLGGNPNLVSKPDNQPVNRPPNPPVNRTNNRTAKAKNPESRSQNPEPPPPTIPPAIPPDDPWSVVVVDLTELGMSNPEGVVEACRSNGWTPEAAKALADHFVNHRAAEGWESVGMLRTKLLARWQRLPPDQVLTLRKSGKPVKSEAGDPVDPLSRWLAMDATTRNDRRRDLTRRHGPAIDAMSREERMDLLRGQQPSIVNLAAVAEPRWKSCGQSADLMLLEMESRAAVASR